LSGKLSLATPNPKRKLTKKDSHVNSPRYYPNIFEIPFIFESTLIIVSTLQVMRVFRGSVFRVQERKAGVLPLLSPEL